MRNKYSLLLLFLAWLPFSQAQETNYFFIRQEANKLHYDSTSAPMQAFFQKWNRMVISHQGNISIIHIGGSHVQAGTLPHRIRTNILSAYPTLVSGRGLIFPYSAAANCNNPNDYRVHCPQRVILTRNVHKEPAYPLGLCGIAVTAHDEPTTIQILNTDTQFDYSVTRVVILGHSPQGVVPQLSYDNHYTSPSYIDSQRHRYIFNLARTVDSIEILLPCGDGQSFTLNGVQLSSRNAGITYNSIGVNGAAVPDYLKCNLHDDLHLLHPDLVIFGIGINDAHGTDFDSVAFRRNYLKLCDSIRSINPQCAFIFITNNDCYRKTSRRSYSVNTNGLQVRDVCYRLAAATGGAVWDQFEIMGGLRSMEKWQKAGLAQKDKVHFTRAGYQLIGDMFSQALLDAIHSAKPVKAIKTDNKVKAKSPDDLPRGLRRKPRKHVTIQPTPSPNSNENDNRFPYISD